MTRRLAVAVAVVVLAACSSDGPDVDVEGGAPRDGGTVGTLSQLGERVAFELTADPDPPTSDAPVTWAFIVRNVSGTAVTVTFPSGQQADVTLQRDGTEAYRWSEERVFTQALQEWTLQPDEERRFRLDEERLDVPPGQYELTASLTSDQKVEAASKQVTVAAPEE